jgi:O-antigen ligase
MTDPNPSLRPNDPTSSFPVAAMTPVLLLVLAFPIAGIQAKHAMTLIAIALAVALGGLVLVRRRWPVLDWRLPVVVAAFLAWSGIWVGIDALSGAGCARCFDKWLEVVGFAIVLLPLATGMLGRAAGVRPGPVLTALGVGVAVGAVMLVIELTFDAPIYRLLSGKDEATEIGLSRFNRGAVATVLLAIPVIGWLLVTGRNLRNRALLGAVLTLGLLGLTVYGASGAAVLSLVMAVIFGVGAWLSARMAVLVLAAGLLIGGVGAPWIGGQFLSRQIESGAEMSLPTRHRLEIWDHASHYAMEAPLAGWGIGSYRTLPLEAPNAQDYRISEKTASHPHNALLELWVETGAVGVALWLAALGLILRAASRLDRIPRATAIAAIAGGLVPAMVSFGMWQSTYLAILAMTAFGVWLVSRIRENESP